MTDFNLSNVAPNDVLVWSEIEEAFVNVKPSTQSLFIDLPDYRVMPLSQNGHNVVHRFTGEQLQTRTLVGGDGITITQSDGALEISAEDMDATTVGDMTLEIFSSREPTVRTRCCAITRPFGRLHQRRNPRRIHGS